MTKNIALAIQKEEEYLKDKLNGQVLDIYDYLIQAGYDNIDEYRNDA